jgi:hypothetical protein
VEMLVMVVIPSNERSTRSNQYSRLSWYQAFTDL